MKILLISNSPYPPTGIGGIFERRIVKRLSKLEHPRVAEE